MSEQKHTPEPWKMARRGVALRRPQGGGCPLSTQKANIGWETRHDEKWGFVKSSSEKYTLRKRGVFWKSSVFFEAVHFLNRPYNVRAWSTKKTIYPRRRSLGDHASTKQTEARLLFAAIRCPT